MVSLYQLLDLTHKNHNQVGKQWSVQAEQKLQLEEGTDLEFIAIFVFQIIY